MYKVFIILLALLFNFSFKLFSQESNYKTKFYNLIIDEENGHKSPDKNSFNLLSFYKEYISSQDHDHCPYHPSCSLYTFSAIKKDGIFIGLIKGFDRLSRCNRNQEYQYFLNTDHKMIDLP